jgi:DUF4097 and DUF4098 domain-containing protein YvlB
VRRDETFTVHEHAAVDVELPAGSVLVRAGASGIVTVSIDSSNADHIDVAQVGDGISIRATRRGRSARIAIDVPIGTDVNVRGASVEVVGRGALGSLRVRSASGDVRADDLVRADITLASGDLRLELVRGDGDFKATSGDIVVRSVGGRLAASLASGDLQIAEVGGDADVETASGKVTIERCNGSAIAVRTVSGDIRLGLPSGIRVEPEISTMSGKVRLPEPSGARADGERRLVRVRLRSVSGDIRIQRA